MRQDRHVALNSPSRAGAAGPRASRQSDRIRRPQSAGAVRTRAARGSWQSDRDDLSGADDLAEPRVHGRGSDCRSRHYPSAPVAWRRAGPRDRDAAPGRHSRPRRARRPLPPSAVGRHAPARHDRDGARVSPQGLDRGRTDDRARRDDSGPDPRAPRPPAARAGHGGVADHARPRSRRGPRRSRRRDVRGTCRRDGADRRALRAPGASLHRGIARRGPAHRRAARTAACHPRPGAGGNGVATRLPVSSSLSVRLGQMRGAGAAAARDRDSGTYRALLARDRTRAETMTLVDVRDLVKYYAGERSWFGLGRAKAPVRAVDGVSFTIASGRTLGLVGESGSGKTTVGRTMLRLQEPTSGTVLFEENDVFALDATRLRALRRRMQIVFQDPYSSLNPRMTVEETLREPLQIHGLNGAVSALLDEVGLDAAFAKRYPHELSGGSGSASGSRGRCR